MLCHRLSGRKIRRASCVSATMHSISSFSLTLRSTLSRKRAPNTGKEELHLMNPNKCLDVHGDVNDATLGQIVGSNVG
jgi:hypothetical protein